MKSVDKKETKPTSSLRPKLVLKNRSKQPIKQIVKPMNQFSTKLSKQTIFKYSKFWQQHSTSSLQLIKHLLLSDLKLDCLEAQQGFNIFQMTNIETLILSKNRIASLQPIAELDTLIQLNLSHNKVFDLTPLSYLEKLQIIDLSSNKITNIEPIYNLSNLQNVNLATNLLPYRQRDLIIQFGQRLVQFNIKDNDVYREEQKSQWLKGKLRRFNEQAVSSKMKNDMRSTAQSFRPSSSVLMTRPSTARTVQSTQQDLRSKVQKAQYQYVKLDNLYQQQIVKNVNLKSQLVRKSQKARLFHQNQQTCVELKQKIQSLRTNIQSLKSGLFNKSNLKLKQLFDLTIKYQKFKSSSNQTKVDCVPQNKIPKKISPRQLLQQQKPFHADEQFVFESDESDSPPKYQNSDDELEQMLRKNQEQINNLQAELRLLK